MKMNNSSIIQDQIDGEQDDKGFTLIEILIAIVLVGILSAVAVVGISNLVSKGIVVCVWRDRRCGKGRLGRVLRRQLQHLPDQFTRDHTAVGTCHPAPHGVRPVQSSAATTGHDLVCWCWTSSR